MEQRQPLWPGGPVMAQEPGAPLGTDSVLLADFARAAGLRRGVDLGCGSGVLALLLLWREPRLRMTGLELRAEAAELARENLAANGLLERGEILTADLRESRALFPGGSFDFAVSNPPYFPVGSGALSPDPARRGARGEESCSLSALCDAAAWLLHTGGRFFLVHRSERLSELCCTLSARGLESKRLRLVSHRADSAPGLVLLEARRGGKPGVQVEPPLILTEPGGAPSAEARRIWRLDETE